MLPNKPGRHLDDAAKIEIIDWIRREDRAGRPPRVIDTCQQFKVGKNTARPLVQQARGEGIGAAGPSPPASRGVGQSPAIGPASAELVISGNVATSTFLSDRRIVTEADAIAYAQIDTSVWFVRRMKVGAWTTPMRVRRGQDDTKRNIADQPSEIQCWKVSLELERIQSKPKHETLQSILETIANYAPAYTPIHLSIRHRPHCLELDLFDAHLGKLAWAAETGDDFDLKIAERIFKEAIEDLLYQARNYEFERAFFPIGNDFLQIDGPLNATSNGTTVDTDGRFKKIIAVGQMALVHAVEELRRHVDHVHVISVPGNHDGETTWMNARFLWAWFRNAKDVEVDTSPRERKCFTYGRNMIGLAHGDEIPAAKLPVIFAQEFRKEWGAAETVEIHCGHFHKAKQVVTTPVDTHEGTTVRYLQSLSAKDKWHYKKGFIGSRRAAEAFAWSPDDGLAANFFAQVRRAR